MFYRAIAAAVLGAFSAMAGATCLSGAEVSAIFDACNRRVPAANPEGLSAADGVFEALPGTAMVMVSFK